jgi:hypothetical protein
MCTCLYASFLPLRPAAAMSILFPIYHCLGCLKALLLTFNFEHHELTSTFLFRAFVRLRLRTLKQMPRITLSLFVLFHFSHSLLETAVCASDYPFYFRGSSASGASEISLDPGNPTLSTSPISRSRTVQKESLLRPLSFFLTPIISPRIAWLLCIVRPISFQIIPAFSATDINLLARKESTSGQFLHRNTQRRGECMIYFPSPGP